jgi:hypothetical protein
MQIEKLRSLIRESVKDHIKEIEAVAEAAAMEARLAEYDKAIKMCEEKIATAENLEEVKDLMDEGKINELKKKLKDLKNKKGKLEKAKAKKNKGKEVTTDAETDKEETVDEMDMEKNAIVPEMEYTMDEMDMKDEALNESFLKMQKLAGVITETQYNQKKKALVESQLNEFFDKWNNIPPANEEHLKKSTGKEPIRIWADSDNNVGNYLITKGLDNKYYLHNSRDNYKKFEGPFNSEEDAKKGVK